MNIKLIIPAIGVIIFTIIFIRFVFKDYIEQIRSIKGREYRKQHGILLEGHYLENGNCIKDNVWLKQKNRGIHPRKLNKPITIIDYSSKCDLIVPKKGL